MYGSHSYVFDIVFRFGACCRPLTLSVRNARHLVDYDIVPSTKVVTAVKRPSPNKVKRPRETVLSPPRKKIHKDKTPRTSPSGSTNPAKKRKIDKVTKLSKRISPVRIKIPSIVVRQVGH